MRSLSRLTRGGSSKRNLEKGYGCGAAVPGAGFSDGTGLGTDEWVPNANLRYAESRLGTGYGDGNAKGSGDGRGCGICDTINDGDGSGFGGGIACGSGTEAGNGHSRGPA